MEVVRKAAFAVLFQPVGVREVRADFRDRVADSFLIFGEREVHV
jgi:hypothetical protein